MLVQVVFCCHANHKKNSGLRALWVSQMRLRDDNASVSTLVTNPRRKALRVPSPLPPGLCLPSVRSSGAFWPEISVPGRTADMPYILCHLSLCGTTCVLLATVVTIPLPGSRASSGWGLVSSLRAESPSHRSAWPMTITQCLLNA